MTSPKHALSKKRQARPDLAAAGRSHQGLGERLNQMLLSASLPPLDPGQLASFEGQLSLIIRWNARTNITAIRDEEGILSRHFFESIACARTLPAGIRTLLDFGSGAGFPGIPIAIVRPEIAVTLAESQGKKAAFLQEAVRVLNLPSIRVHAGRAETLDAVFEAVTLRAVDRMEEAVQSAVRLTASSGWLVLMTTESDMERLKEAAGDGFRWDHPVNIPGGENRIILSGQRQ
jgi:16S rRNA (guanine527-N7)-methyltransferase